MTVTAPAPPSTITCPRCQAQVAPDQDWCLSCGAPARTRLAGTPNWRTPAAVLLAVVLIAGGALAVAFAALTDDNGRGVPPVATETAPVPAPAAGTVPAPVPAPAPGTVPPADPNAVDPNAAATPAPKVAGSLVPNTGVPPATGRLP